MVNETLIVVSNHLLQIIHQFFVEGSDAVGTSLLCSAMLQGGLGVDGKNLATQNLISVR